MNSTNINIYTISKQNNGNGSQSAVLKKKGTICSCPFRNPTILPHPSIQGQMIIHNPICSDMCQFFNLFEERSSLHLDCSDVTLEILIEKEEKIGLSRPQDTNLFKL